MLFTYPNLLKFSTASRICQIDSSKTSLKIFFSSKSLLKVCSRNRSFGLQSVKKPLQGFLGSLDCLTWLSAIRHGLSMSSYFALMSNLKSLHNLIVRSLHVFRLFHHLIFNFSRKRKELIKIRLISFNQTSSF